MKMHNADYDDLIDDEYDYQSDKDEESPFFSQGDI